MKVEDLFASIDVLEKMSDAELREYFAPCFPACRPSPSKPLPIHGAKKGGVAQVVLTPKQRAKEQQGVTDEQKKVLAQYNIDFDSLMYKGQKKGK